MGRRARTTHPARRWDRYARGDGDPVECTEGLFELGPAPITGEDGVVEPDGGPAAGPEPGPRRRWALSAGLTAVVAALLMACGGLWWWSVASDPPSVRSVDALEPDARAQGTPTASSPPSPATDDGGRQLVVHVTGAVGAPGVYRLPEGKRVNDAIAAAGGPAAGAEPDRLNLAAPLVDGARLVVPRQGDPIEEAVATPSPSASSGRGGAAGKVNVNRASVDELAGLPRVGPVLAQRIVDYRNQHGRFATVDALDAVPGIGTRMLDSLRPNVTV